MKETIIGKITKVINSSEVHFNGSGEFCFDYRCGESLNSIIRKICKTIDFANAQINGIFFQTDGSIKISLSNGDEFVTDSLDTRYYTKEEIDELLSELSSSFLELSDTPNSYNGEAGKLISVKQDESGLEFIELPSSGTIDDVIADLTVGGINAGDTVPSGTDIQELTELLLKTTFYPIFIHPSITMSNSIGNNIVEVGDSQILTLSLSFNRGEIRGDVSPSPPFTWNPNLFQNHRSGAVTNYVINNLTTGPSSSTIINGYIPINGNNTFTGYANYAVGPQPLDSQGANYLTPLPSGQTTIVTTTFLAQYKQFFGNVLSFPTTSLEVRSLENNNFANINTFNSFISSTKYVLAIPTTKNLVSVITANFENITSRFTLSSLSTVNDAGGDSRNYKVYEFSSDSPLNLNITINLS
jgi:hypothetical protein